MTQNGSRCTRPFKSTKNTDTRRRFILTRNIPVGSCISIILATKRSRRSRHSPIKDPTFWRSTIQPWIPTEPGRHPTSFLLLHPFFFLLFHPILSFPPVLRIRENSASPLNNGRTLTIFAAVYQDLDPNGSLGECTALSLFPFRLSTRI